MKGDKEKCPKLIYEISMLLADGGIDIYDLYRKEPLPKRKIPVEAKPIIVGEEKI